MASYALRPTDGLIVVDAQNDFLPGGSLAVAEGDRIFAPLNRLMPRFTRVYATRDWHPKNHKYFQAEGGIWPYHCLQNTPGAEFSPKLNAGEIDAVVSKGVDPKTDGYSGFAATDLEQRMRADGITRVFVGGLATDYCVKATAIEAKRRGFDVVVLEDAIAAVKLKPEDEDEALRAMRDAGCELATSAEVQ
jgi:nicotinamidase-related amidase